MDTLSLSIKGSPLLESAILQIAGARVKDYLKLMIENEFDELTTLVLIINEQTTLTELIHFAEHYNNEWIDIEVEVDKFAYLSSDELKVFKSKTGPYIDLPLLKALELHMEVNIKETFNLLHHQATYVIDGF